MITVFRMLFGAVLIVGTISAVDAQEPTSRPNIPFIASISFEEAKPGPFDRLETAIGTWTPEVGRTIVDDKHAKTGKHCLQLPGGDRTSVTLQIAEEVDTSGSLSFWAERWTRRTPFSFRIEKNCGGSWKEIFNGDKKVRVGRAFLSHVMVPLGDDTIKQLRLTVTSPPKAGILIDDIRIAPAQPQEIVGVEIAPFSLPALVGNDSSPLVKLRVETTGILNPISVTEIRGTLDGTTDRSDLASVHVRSGGTQQETQPAADGSFACALPESLGKLKEGENFLWVCGRLSKDANIDHRVGAAITEVAFSNGQTMTLDAAPSMQRMGIAVRQGDDDGVHTYRIPGLTTTNRGTLIGVYDVRRRGGGDLPGDIDVGMSRSTDGGRTWESMEVIMDMGDDPQWHYDGIGDPALLVDRGTGTIWVAATWSHGNRSWRGSGPGLQPEETGQLMLVRSDDDGVTWSEPINITKQVKQPEWCFILQGPGKGITMRDGTIVFAAQYQDPPERNRLPHSTIIYSKDHGETWHVGTGVFDDTTESQVVEIEPGVLMLNCRYNRKPVRVVMTTRDMGKTWQRHTTSERALIEPGACMASLIDVDRELFRSRSRETSVEPRGDTRTLTSPATDWLLFSNPDSSRGRHHITIKASPDRGLTWPKEHRLLLDEGNGRGYSCMTMIDEETVGILYEGSQAHMTFQRIPLNDPIGEAEPSKPASAVESRLRLPRVFSNHMVLQAETEIPVWGRARPGATVTVTLGDDTRTATAGGQDQWQVRLKPRRANATPATMRIQSAEERIEFRDILVGEVWVCAGQSNMEWMLQQSAHGKEELAGLVAEVAKTSGKRQETELLASSATKSLRLLNLSGGARGSSGSYTLEHLARLTPETFCEGQWQIASAESAASFSAVAWYFGRHLQQELNVPIGLICPAVGGTPAEAWISREALAAAPQMTGLLAGNWLDNERLGEFCRTRGEQNLLSAIQAGEAVPGDALGPNHSFKPGFMWDAGIAPLIPYAIRGAIWYQGESNAETPARVREHGRLLPLLINQWREHWGQGDFPFLYAQLPALNRPEWPWFRDGQRRVLNQLNNVGMAITIDTGHPTNVHPTAKKPVGERLAKCALGTTYGLPTDASSGPLFDVARRKGDSMIVSFIHTGDGLKSSDGNALRYFEICGGDGVFHTANARITGQNTATVSSPRVAEPQHVRYAWVPFPNPPVNLFNSANLPASPFSTESEEMLFARTKECCVRGANNDSRPNILLIMVDDMGYSDIGCYGGEIDTPNIDRLADNGLRFSQFYNCGRCCPTRASLLTGLYPHKTGLGFMTARDYGKPGYRAELNRNCVTLAEALKLGGYRTYMAGKWHVCKNFAADGPKHNWPLQRGVDRFFGTLIAAGSQWNPMTLTEGNKPVEPDDDFFYTEAISRKAVEYIESHDAADPFFLYLAHTAPHWPLHARSNVIEKYRGRFADGWDVLRRRRLDRLVQAGILSEHLGLSDRGEGIPPWKDAPHKQWEQNRMEAYAAMVDHVDQGVGDIVQALERKGLLENTLIFFLSDNGGDSLEHPDGRIGSTGKPWAYMRYVPLYTRDGRPIIAGDYPGLKLGPDQTYGGYGTKWANLSNAPFRYYKKYAHEGGISTPFIAHWPNKIKSRGQIRHQPAHVIDIMATCLDAADAEYPGTYQGNSIQALDGKSLLPVFDRDQPVHSFLCWEHHGNRAIRKGDWKLSAVHGKEWELYDLTSDRTETRNVASQHPRFVAELSSIYRDWAKDCGVLPVEALQVKEIPDAENPLTRNPVEMKAFLQAINKTLEQRGLPLFGYDE